MRTFLLAIALLAAIGTVSVAQYHAMDFLMGGYGSSSTTQAKGIWLADGNAQTYTHLTPNDNIYYMRGGIKMDANNKDIIFGVEGTTSTSYSTYLRSGIYRLDPATLNITTVRASTLDLYTVRHLTVNQDGDYVFTAYHATTSPTTRAYSVMKLDQANNLTTIFGSTNLGGTFTSYGNGRDIDTGHYLLNVYRSGTLYYGVARVAEDGTWTTFAGGPNSTDYGWYGYYSKLEQNIATGDLEGYYYRNLYQLKKGSAGPRSTLWQLGLPGGFTMRYCGLTDNQSAASPRFIASGYQTKLINGLSTNMPTVFTIDAAPPYLVTATNCDPTNTSGFRYNYTYSFAFYRGRHVQPVKTAPNKWDVAFSCPDFPLKSYVAAISLAGVRPAIPLKDGRSIHLMPDPFTLYSLAGLLKPFYDAGPGRLNAQGEALGSLDLSLLGTLNMPLWIQLLVLDPTAPSGIAYIPDPYVMRV